MYKEVEDEDMEFNHLKQLLSKRGEKIKLSKATGISTGNISDWFSENRTSKPSLETLCKLAVYFNCSVDYLLDRTEDKRFNNATIYRFPIYEDQQAAAGAGIYGRDSNFQMEDIICDNIPDKAVFGLKIKGDSMEPEIPDGSTVLLNPNISLEEVINKNIVASIEGEVVCKRFTVENNMYCFSSLNPDRQNMNRKTNDINFKIIGEIVKVI